MIIVCQIAWLLPRCPEYSSISGLSPSTTTHGVLLCSPQPEVSGFQRCLFRVSGPVKITHIRSYPQISFFPWLFIKHHQQNISAGGEWLPGSFAQCSPTYNSSPTPVGGKAFEQSWQSRAAGEETLLLSLMDLLDLCKTHMVEGKNRLHRVVACVWGRVGGRCVPCCGICMWVGVYTHPWAHVHICSHTNNSG